MVGKPSNSSSINHPVVAPVAYINDLPLYKLAITILWNALKLSDGHNAHLRGQDQRTSMSASNGSNIRQADSAADQLFRCKFCFLRQVSQSLKLLLDVSQIESVDVLNMRDYQSILRVNGNADVMAGMNTIFIGICFGMIKGVHLWVVLQG
jgi:hypothetical protein